VAFEDGSCASAQRAEGALSGVEVEGDEVDPVCLVSVELFAGLLQSAPLDLVA